MKLSVAERIILFGLLPEKGTFLNLKQIRKVREDASFSRADTDTGHWTHPEFERSS